eukprot:NODE_8764_length_1472_cov_1.707807.p1 GENE.NODE_8764_length_1472_cov_1.707807~~NODE_8764_length_1472_cov_1.707807.p1  ORF type:complete len:459 (-),score=108.59 NODE_8764_length_1472_cov_1.707807:13-1389(-)
MFHELMEEPARSYTIDTSMVLQTLRNVRRQRSLQDCQDWQELFQATWLPEGWRSPDDDDDILITKFVCELVKVLDVEMCFGVLKLMDDMGHIKRSSDGGVACNGRSATEMPRNRMAAPPSTRIAAVPWPVVTLGQSPVPSQLQDQPRHQPALHRPPQATTPAPMRQQRQQHHHHHQPAATFTTLVVRNMHKDFDQASTEAWVNAAGFKASYDFLICFPQRSQSYAFINFESTLVAAMFRRKFHGMPSEPPEDKAADASTEGKLLLSVVWAKVQGFRANLWEFRHLSRSQANLLPVQVTNCQPYFLQEAVRPMEHVTLDDVEFDPVWAGEASWLPESEKTTAVVTNVPPISGNQENCMKFLDSVGFKSMYNFFLYIPAKTARGTPTPNCARIFANFVTHKAAKDCMKIFHGRTLREHPKLYVVFAKTQGLEACKAGCAASRYKPWVMGESDNMAFTAFQ